MFCPNCGKELPKDARFCGSCGTRLTAEPMGNGERSVSASSPAQGPSPARAESNAPSEAPKAEKPKKTAKRAVGAAKAAAKETLVSAGQEVHLFSASPEGGETALGLLGRDLPESSALIPGPLKALGGGLKSLFASLAAAFRKPKRLIPA